MQINLPRTDIASRKAYPKQQLLRLVVAAGKLTIDSQGNLPGRGYYLKKDAASLETAIKKKAFERILRRPLSEEELCAIKEAI